MASRYEEIYSDSLAEKTAEATCCDVNIVKLKETLLLELNDEIEASEMYEKAAFAMKDDAGLRELGEVLHKISLQEYEHFVRLAAMVNILNEMCSCKKGE